MSFAREIARDVLPAYSSCHIIRNESAGAPGRCVNEETWITRYFRTKLRIRSEARIQERLHCDRRRESIRPAQDVSARLGGIAGQSHAADEFRLRSSAPRAAFDAAWFSSRAARSSSSFIVELERELRRKRTRSGERKSPRIAYEIEITIIIPALPNILSNPLRERTPCSTFGCELGGRGDRS